MSQSRYQHWLKQHPKWLVLLFVLIPALLLFLLMRAAGAGQVAAPPKKPMEQKVEVFALEAQSAYTRMLEVVGRAEAGNRSVLGFERGGTLSNAYVDEGMAVKKGVLMAELDTSRLQAQLKELQAAIERAEAEARLAVLSEQRIAKLVADRLESPQRLDETREATKAANALVVETKARKDSLLVEFEKSKIFAPFDGTILARPVDPGSVVAVGQAIFTMQQAQSTEVRMAMAADQAFSLTIGDGYTLQANGAEFPSVLKSVASARTLNTRTVDAIFQIKDTGNGQRVLPGDLLRLQWPQEIQADGFWVPRSSLSNGIRGMWNLLTVNGLGDNQVVVPKTVSVLYSDSERAFVAGALQETDYVVLHGAHRLVPNQLVVATEVNVSEWVRR